ncbi:uncharacterized protein LOC114885669 isoform X3 [Monodon monoceros]|uniref:uncharacterized protein LOC114885669 isoform X3 n=1 Tax=Monodon monoceros TaxID=40151 RepID=UPI0010F8BD76|nr:uncharacterized protein LOC114885669 isoform X3 [Monodon monoceros]
MVSVTSWTGSTWETGHTLREPVALYTGKWPEWISLQETKKAGNLQSPHSLQAPKCLLGTWCALGITAQVQQDGSPRKRLCREPGAEGLHAWPPPYSVGQTPMRRRTWVLADVRLPLGCALNPQMCSGTEPATSPRCACICGVRENMSPKNNGTGVLSFPREPVCRGCSSCNPVAPEEDRCSEPRLAGEVWLPEAVTQAIKGN